VITSRYLTPHDLHAAHSVTGAICVASCALLEDTVAEALASRDASDGGTVRIEHPSGVIDVRLETRGSGTHLRILRAGVVRTARKIMDGELFVPASVWPLET
jgi:2-methylaconitate cis-trans-isomerase PrpF